MKAPFLLGRMLFGGFFLYNGINHLRQAKSMGPYAESKGVPAGELAVKLSAVPLIVGGTSLLLGVKPKLGTMAILGFLAGVSPVMHDFWRQEDPDQKQNEMINFAKNMALPAVHSPSWASMSLGKRACRRVKRRWDARFAKLAALSQRRPSTEGKRTGRKPWTQNPSSLSSTNCLTNCSPILNRWKRKTRRSCSF